MTALGSRSWSADDERCTVSVDGPALARGEPTKNRGKTAECRRLLQAPTGGGSKKRTRGCWRDPPAACLDFVRSATVIDPPRCARAANIREAARRCEDGNRAERTENRAGLGPLRRSPTEPGRRGFPRAGSSRDRADCGHIADLTSPATVGRRRGRRTERRCGPALCRGERAAAMVAWGCSPVPRWSASRDASPCASGSGAGAGICSFEKRGSISSRIARW